jgi:hypothetical protein
MIFCGFLSFGVWPYGYGVIVLVAIRRVRIKIYGYAVNNFFGVKKIRNKETKNKKRIDK